MDNREFFNSMASRWDEICCHPAEKIEYIMDRIQLRKGDNVFDIGSGTGITLPFIEKRIGKEGKIVALDIAENMIEISKKKNVYSNIVFVVDDFYQYSSKETFDCILAYSCYPHFQDKENFFKKAFSLLKTGGKIVIAHIEAREKINNRHSDVKDRIVSESLPKAHQTADLMEKCNLEVNYLEDNSEYYICIGEKLI